MTPAALFKDSSLELLFGVKVSVSSLYIHLQAIDSKRVGSANGGRTRIFRLLVLSLSY
jgi:predicted Kef-type K+ transport protein